MGVGFGLGWIENFVVEECFGFIGWVEVNDVEFV